MSGARGDERERLRDLAARLTVASQIAGVGRGGFTYATAHSHSTIEKLLIQAGDMKPRSFPEFSKRGNERRAAKAKWLAELKANPNPSQARKYHPPRKSKTEISHAG